MVFDRRIRPDGPPTRLGIVAAPPPNL